MVQNVLNYKVAEKVKVAKLIMPVDQVSTQLNVVVCLTRIKMNPRNLVWSDVLHDLFSTTKKVRTPVYCKTQKRITTGKPTCL